MYIYVAHQYEHPFFVLILIYLLHMTSSRFSSYLLTFIKETHAHKHTCMISTQEELGQSGTRACLEGDDERLLSETTALQTQKKMSETPISRIQKKILST